MNTDKTYRQFHKDSDRSSAIRRLIIASLMVMGFFGIFWNRNVVRGFNYTPIDAHITFVCQKVEDIKNNKYHICINSESANAPAPDKEMITIDDEGKGEFLIHITEPGNFDYLLYQNKDSEKDIKYDEAKYEVHVFVTSDDNGKLSYQVSINLADTATKPEVVIFKNSSTKKPETPESEVPTTEAPTVETPTTEASSEEDGHTGPTTEEQEKEEASTEDTGDNETVEKDQDTKKTGSKNAHTGDTSNILLATFLMIASLSAIIAIVLKKKLKNL